MGEYYNNGIFVTRFVLHYSAAGSCSVLVPSSEHSHAYAASHQIHSTDSIKEIGRVSLLDSVGEGVLNVTIRERCNS